MGENFNRERVYNPLSRKELRAGAMTGGKNNSDFCNQNRISTSKGVEMAMEGNEKQLLRRLKAGKREAREVFYRQYVDRIWRYGYLRTHSREWASEICQDTFLRAFKSVAGFDGRASLGTWLYTVARSVAIDHARDRQERKTTMSDSNVLKLVTAEEQSDVLEEQEKTQAIHRAIATLPGAQRDVIALFELASMSVKETASCLGWSESRVKVTLHRARRNLRDSLLDLVGEDKAKLSG